MQTRHFQGGNLCLAADVGGPPDGPAVLLLHGGGQTRHAWGLTARTLAERGYHVVSLDLRGHGDSDWAADGDYSLPQQVADLRAVLTALDRNPPPMLIGASLGGLVSLLTAGASGTPVASRLVLVDVTPQVDPEGDARIRGFMTAHPDGFASVEEAADAVAAYLPHRQRPRDTSGLRRNLRRRRNGRWYWHWDPRLFDRLDTRKAEIQAMLENAARRVNIPTLLIRGALSELVTEESLRHFLSLIPGADYVDVADAGHMLAGDRNDAFNAAVLNFLDDTIHPEQEHG